MGSTYQVVLGLVVVVVLVLVPVLLSAQDEWVESGRKQQFGVEQHKPEAGVEAVKQRTL